MRKYLIGAILWTSASAVALFAQAPSKIDFARDVQPLFKEYCVGCHGPSQQLSDFRLDERASVLKDGARRVVPGSSENSRIYLRLVGSEYGLQMPPTGPLSHDQLEDGSWHVKTRSIPIQPYFESDFPHGSDQWISVAATNWAAMALAPAAR